MRTTYDDKDCREDRPHQPGSAHGKPALVESSKSGSGYPAGSSSPGSAAVSKNADPYAGTEGSNPVPSSKESATKFLRRSACLSDCYYAANEKWSSESRVLGGRPGTTIEAPGADRLHRRGRPMPHRCKLGRRHRARISPVSQASSGS